MWWWWRPQWAHYTIHWRRQWPCQWRDMLLTTRETHTNRNGRSGWWRFGVLGALYTLSVLASWFGLSTALCRQQTTTQCHLHDNRECTTSCQRTPNTIRQKRREPRRSQLIISGRLLMLLMMFSFFCLSPDMTVSIVCLITQNTPKLSEITIDSANDDDDGKN